MQIDIGDIDTLLEDTLNMGGYDWLSEDTELATDLQLDVDQGAEFMEAFFERFEIEPRGFNPSYFFSPPPYKLPLWFSALFVAIVCTLLAIGTSVIVGGLIVLAMAFFADQFLIEPPKAPDMDISIKHLIAVAKVGYWIDAGTLEVPGTLSS